MRRSRVVILQNDRDGVQQQDLVDMTADANMSTGETSLDTLTFSEAVTGLTNADLTVAKGTLSAASSGNGGVTWMATLTPAANTTDANNCAIDTVPAPAPEPPHHHPLIAVMTKTSLVLLIHDSITWPLCCAIPHLWHRSWCWTEPTMRLNKLGLTHKGHSI